jgi:hypothetical protein
MFKGIYNEAEFYTNFYFENKLSNDLLLKVGAFSDLKARTDKFKALDTVYWTMRDNQKNKKDNLVDFYSKILKVLSFEQKIEKNPTLKEANISTIAKVSKNSIPEFLFFLMEGDSLESSPLNIDLDIDDAPEERELQDIISEYFDELENPPKWILLGAPTALFLLERNKWSRGQFLKFNWDEIFQQKTEDLFASIIGLVSHDSLCPDSGSSLHEEIDDNSHRQAHEVTTELRESVRESIELLINELIHQKKETHEAYFKKGNSDIYAKELSHDALFYVYRLIFLLYLESQGEDSDLLPLKSEIYRHGYSLEKLLELIHDIPDENTKDFEGSFVHESLEQVFNLIYNGFSYKIEKDLFNLEEITTTGFLIKGIKSDLFNPDTIKHLKGIKLRNGVLLQILHKLSLSTVGKGRNKKLTRVSYSNLGINQLGAVYEGLLSYSGFFAAEDLHALKPTSIKQTDLDAGKEQDQIYLAPKSLVEKYKNAKEKKYKLTNDNIVLDENGNPKIYKKGSFIYRLAGRDRQKLASFYTPESLTKCTVKYSLKVLFETKKTLDDLWKVKVLEPAMGSGAFLNEAVNQLSDKILELEVQQKVGDLKTPKDKQKRLYEIKYRLISENVYGVDLNPTAIELARFSLWLNCTGAGKEPPKFDGRLKVGNSLIGARFKKGADGVYPWLLLDDGMMNYGKRLKDYDAEGFQKIQDFRKELLFSKIESSDSKIKALQQKSENLLKELITSNDQNKKKSAYDRLKLCGDLWCSAFFLTADDLKSFPKKHEEICRVFEAILENGSIDPKLLSLVEGKYNNERFFHWEIEFPEIIASGGFDLILGNPPWLAVEWRDLLYVSDVNPVPAALDFNAAQTKIFVDDLQDDSVKKFLSAEFTKITGYSNLLETSFYTKLAGIPKNTYKAFDVLSFYLLSPKGVLGIIQEDGILEDKKAGAFRKELYRNFKYHFQFQNEKFLFSEVGHAKRLSINVFQINNSNELMFDHVGNLFLPSTIDACFTSSTQTDNIPLIKTLDGEWDTRGHKKRIVNINQSTLNLFSRFLSDENEDVPVFLNLHSDPLLGVIRKISLAKNTVESFLGKDNVSVFDGLDETVAQREKIISETPLIPKRLEEVIYSAPQIVAANPLAKQSLEIYTSKFSFEEIDLENILDDFIPRCRYKLLLEPTAIDRPFSLGNPKKYSSYFKIFSRSMINPTNERCMFSSILPRGVSHVNSIRSIAISKEEDLPAMCGIFSSLLIDGIQRIKNKTNFYANDFLSIPIGENLQYIDSIGRRALCLNALTLHYNDIWLKSVKLKKSDSLISGQEITGFGQTFKKEQTFRNKDIREQATIEIDALTALLFDLTEEELVQVYEILFPVMNMYDRERKFDRKAKLIEAHRFFKERGW